MEAAAGNVSGYKALPALTPFQFEGPTLSSRSLPRGGGRPPELTAAGSVAALSSETAPVSAQTGRLFQPQLHPQEAPHQRFSSWGNCWASRGAAALPKSMEKDPRFPPASSENVQLPTPSSLALSCCGRCAAVCEVLATLGSQRLANNSGVAEAMLGRGCCGTGTPRREDARQAGSLLLPPSPRHLVCRRSGPLGETFALQDLSSKAGAVGKSPPSHLLSSSLSAFGCPWLWV